MKGFSILALLPPPMCGGEHDANGWHLAGFSKDVAFAYHFLTTRPPSTLPPCMSATGIGYASKTI